MRKKVSSEYNLGVIRPDLVNVWSRKNKLSPYQVAPKSGFVALWVCSCGVEWKAPVRNVRTGKCKKCNFNRSTPENNFAAVFPEKVKMWSTNNEFGPDEVTQKSGKRALWICEKGHEWDAIISSVASGAGCPYCVNQRVLEAKSFAAELPDKAKYWDYEKNNGLKPTQVAPKSNKKYWFVCERKHSFDVRLGNISSLNRWCPYCAGAKPTDDNNLQTVAPTLAAQWHPLKNAKPPTAYLPKSNVKVWWKCEKGHEWEAYIYSRFAGSDCPKCGNKALSDTNSLAYRFPEVALEYDAEANKIGDPKLIIGTTTKSVWWKCKYGHKWQTPVRNRTTGLKTGCPDCSPQSSYPEIRLFVELDAAFGGAKRRAKVGGVEVDIWLSDHDLSIEYDGAYYHTKMTEKDRAKNKALMGSGQTVVRVRERPLRRISENDFLMLKRPNLTKDSIDEFMDHLAKLMPNLKGQVFSYKKADTFLDDKTFKELVYHLPGPGPEDSLAALKPAVAAEWNYERNAPLRPELFHPRSGKKVWWTCNKEHEWEATIDKRVSGRKCPVCAGKMVHPDNCLAKLDPEITALWYQPQNKLTPNDVTLNSGKKAWFKCENGHFTYTAVASKVKSRGCQFCPGIGRNRKYTPPDFENN